MTAQRIRAFLLASATTAFCQPQRSRSRCTHCEMGSPALLQRYFDLWEKHSQGPDPLLTPMFQRPHYEYALNGIPY